jgi:hypothetical protein
VTGAVIETGKRIGLTGRWGLDGVLEQGGQDGRVTDEGAPMDGSKPREAYGQEEQPGQPVLGTAIAPLLRSVLGFCPGRAWWQRLLYGERGLHKGLGTCGGTRIGRRG